jgi:hypothetical protein
MAARYVLPLVQVPPRGLWRRSGMARHTTVRSWLGAEPDPATSPDGVVIRYLAAYGPATAADVRAWSGVAGLRAAIERLRPRLRTFRDERGRELFDVPDGGLPDPDTPAPVRFLPDYDNALLGHEDRSRVISDEDRRRLMTTVTGTFGTVLLDGFGAAIWRERRGRDEVVLAVSPMRRLSRPELVEVEEEAARLLAFLYPGEVGHEVRVLAG